MPRRPPGPPAHPPGTVLVARAGEAAWFYLIQRELMGLRADGAILDEVGVPGEVRRRMSLDPNRSGASAADLSARAGGGSGSQSWGAAGPVGLGPR